MATESSNICTGHKFTRLEEEKGPNGEWVMVCEKCGLVKYSPPPSSIQESTNDKPLLME